MISREIITVDDDNGNSDNDIDETLLLLQSNSEVEQDLNNFDNLFLW